MQTTTFTEFRRQAKRYFDAVEQGETVRVTRRGRVIARIIPADKEIKPSWKTPIEAANDARCRNKQNNCK